MASTCGQGHRLRRLLHTWGVDADGYVHVLLFACDRCGQVFGMSKDGTSTPVPRETVWRYAS